MRHHGMTELEKVCFNCTKRFLVKFQKHLKPKLTKRKVTVAAYVVHIEKKRGRRLNKRKWNCLVDRINPHHKRFGKNLARNDVAATKLIRALIMTF